MTNTHQNSREAYRRLGSQGDQYHRILSALREHGALTDRELMEVTGLEKSSVSGRISELLRDFRVVEDGDIVCQQTGRRNRLTRATDALERAQLRAVARERAREDVGDMAAIARKIQSIDARTADECANDQRKAQAAERMRERNELLELWVVAVTINGQPKPTEVCMSLDRAQKLFKTALEDNPGVECGLFHGELKLIKTDKTLVHHQPQYFNE